MQINCHSKCVCCNFLGVLKADVTLLPTLLLDYIGTYMYLSAFFLPFSAPFGTSHESPKTVFITILEGYLYVFVVDISKTTLF